MDEEWLSEAIRKCLDKAIQHSFETRQNEHWCGEVRSNVTTTAEYVFLYQAIGININADRESLCRYLLAQQNLDGSWGIAPNHPGDISTTTEAYLALKLLGVPTNNTIMRLARHFVISSGGIERVCILTRFHLAIFGLWPWNSVPELPAELILMPTWSPINIYRLSSWVRSTCIPLLIISHHQPIFPLPNGKSASNDYLDELWNGVREKKVPYTEPLRNLFRKDLLSAMFAAIDQGLCYFNGLRSSFIRGPARQRCVDWILKHQEPEGDWGGIFPAMHFSILALHLERYSVNNQVIKRGLAAIERFAWEDYKGKRIQTCVSPFWDTILMSIGLWDAGVPQNEKCFDRVMDWAKARQVENPNGDWRVLNHSSISGGFPFQYYNQWYPDVDDTAVAILAFLRHDPDNGGSRCVLSAVEWVLDMQNSDGGWAAFDSDNDYAFLNKLPMADMNNLCDPSTPDITGHVIEALGLLQNNKSFQSIDSYDKMSNRIRVSAFHAIKYLADHQEKGGGWYGRWSCNYIYGTSNVLCGLAYWMSVPTAQYLVKSGIDWLKEVQNPDGGFGESFDSYDHAELAGKGTSTATQTAWSVMGFLAHLPPTDEAIQKGATWLVRNFVEQDVGGTWPETVYTSVGFPRFFYMQYSLYPHYFPMMALGRYYAASTKQFQVSA